MQHRSHGVLRQVGGATSVLAGLWLEGVLSAHIVVVECCDKCGGRRLFVFSTRLPSHDPASPTKADGAPPYTLNPKPIRLTLNPKP